MFVIFLLDKSPKAQKNLPQLASWFLFIDVQECNRNTSVKISSGWGCSLVQHCSCANARAQSDLCVSLSTVFFFCQVKPLGSTNLLCYSVGVSHRRGHPFTFNLSPSPSPPFALLAFIFLGLLPRLLLTLPLYRHPRTHLPPESVRNAVSGAYAMCHMNQCFCC